MKLPRVDAHFFFDKDWLSTQFAPSCKVTPPPALQEACCCVCCGDRVRIMRVFLLSAALLLGVEAESQTRVMVGANTLP